MEKPIGWLINKDGSTCAIIPDFVGKGVVLGDIATGKKRYFLGVSYVLLDDQMIRFAEECDYKDVL